MKLSKFALALAFSIGLMGVPKSLGQDTEAFTRFNDQMNAIAEYVHEGCAEDAEKFCSTVNRGEGRLLMCALAHRDQITDQCHGALFDAFVELRNRVHNLQFAVESCEADIEKVCSEVEPGAGRIAQCLIDHKDNISESCQGAIDHFDELN